MINDIQVSANFKLREFQCRCCGTVKLCPKLLAKLQAVRDAWGGPLVITSGFRCSSRNKAVGGAKASFHLLGMAADIAASKNDQQVLKEIAQKIGFSEIILGGNENYVHVAFL